jgi:hypothetical protein
MKNDNNSPKYHTGKKCIENGCDKPAGTAWSPYWCAECNEHRLNRISSNLKKILNPSPKKEDLK